MSSNRQYAFPRKRGKIGKPAHVVAPKATDTQRLDWVITHPDAEFDVDNERLNLCCYIVAYLPNDEDHTKGVSGRFISRGDSHRDCIDAFLRGDVKRID